MKDKASWRSIHFIFLPSFIAIHQLLACLQYPRLAIFWRSNAWFGDFSAVNSQPGCSHFAVTSQSDCSHFAVRLQSLRQTVYKQAAAAALHGLWSTDEGYCRTSMGLVLVCRRGRCWPILDYRAVAVALPKACVPPYLLYCSPPLLMMGNIHYDIYNYSKMSYSTILYI